MIRTGEVSLFTAVTLEKHWHSLFKGTKKTVNCYKQCWGITNQRTNQPHPWSRVLDKLIVTQLLKKFPAFYVNRRFSTVFTKAATGPYNESHESTPHLPNLLVEGGGNWGGHTDTNGLNTVSAPFLRKGKKTWYSIIKHIVARYYCNMVYVYN